MAVIALPLVLLEDISERVIEVEVAVMNIGGGGLVGTVAARTYVSGDHSESPFKFFDL